MKKQIIFIFTFLFLSTFIPTYAQYAYPSNGQYVYPNYGQSTYPINGQYVYPNYGQPIYPSNGQYVYPNSNNNSGFGKKHPILNLLTNALGSRYLNSVQSPYGGGYGNGNSYFANPSAPVNNQQAFVSGFNSPQSNQLPFPDNADLGSDLSDQSDSDL